MHNYYNVLISRYSINYCLELNLLRFLYYLFGGKSWLRIVVITVLKGFVTNSLQYINENE